MSSSVSLRRSLRKIPDFASLSSQALDMLAHQMVCRKYQPDDVLWRTGQNIDFLGVIQSGEVIVEHRMKYLVIRTTRLQAGDVIKPGGIRRSAHTSSILARAVTDVKLYVIPKEKIAELQLIIPIPNNREPMSPPWSSSWNKILVAVVATMILMISWQDISRILSAGLFYISNQANLAYPDHQHSLRLLHYAEIADPVAAFPYNAEGTFWLEQNDLPRAETALTSAISIDQNNAYALNNLGVLYFKTEDFHQALLYQQRAAQLETNNPVVHYNLGINLMRRQSIPEAMLEFKEASHISPDWDLPNLQLAYLHMQRQDFVAAEQAAQKAVSLEPARQTSHLLLAIALYNQGKDQEAVKSAEKALQINPDDEVAGFYKALILIRLKEFDKALSALQQLLDSTDAPHRISRITEEINGLHRTMQNP